jgi:2-oxoglutarate ferredoxin oxidoreductase subunit alpha
MPTRTQQGDILPTAYASHGDTKHIALYPANPEECFYLSAQSFDVAERYQTPVFVLSDLDIGMNEWITRRLSWNDSYRPDRGKVLGAEELETAKEFYRYLDVDGDGVPYRTLPGVHPAGAYFLRGSGHNKYGRYTEKSDEYMEVVDRLRSKVESAAPSLPAPVEVIDDGATFGVITVGSCDLAVREALSRLAAEGRPMSYLRVRAFPFAESVERFAAAHEHLFVVEQNRDGQLRSLMILETAIEKSKLSSVLAYGGMPIDADTVTAGLNEAVSRYEAAKAAGKDVNDELRIKAKGNSPQYIAK